MFGRSCLQQAEKDSQRIPSESNTIQQYVLTPKSFERWGGSIFIRETVLHIVGHSRA